MLNSVTNNKINALAFRGYAAPVQKEITEEEKIATNEIKNDFPVDKAGAEAIKNYNLVRSATNITEPISADDYKNRLINAGMKESKDFRIIDFGSSYTIEVLKNGKVQTAVKWYDGTDKDNFAGYEFSHYYPENNDKIVKRSIRFDNNLKARGFSDTFSNPSEDMISKIVPEEISLNTTAQDYIKNLDEKNVKYKVEKRSNTYISEYDENGKQVKYTSFSEDNNNKKNIWQADYKTGQDIELDNLFTKDGETILTVQDRIKE